jgi:hypothetical protein
VAIDFTSATGGFFPRLGRILHVGYLADVYEATLPAAFDSFENQFEASLQDVSAPVTLARDGLERVASGVMSFATATAQNLVIQTVLADQPSQSLEFLPAMREVIRQMIAQGVTVKKNTITLTPTALSGSVGTGVLVTSTKRGDGLVQENTIAETLRITCVVDSYTGNAIAGRETFGVVGAPVLAGVWDYDYPRGSGAATTAQAVSADQDASPSGNLMTNGNFELWSADATPQLSQFTLSTGVWGTDAQRSTTANRGTYSLQLLPTGANTAIYQEFDNSASGTNVKPNALASYGVNLWLRKLSGTVTGGVLTVELVDSSGTVQNDQQGVPNSFTVTLSTLTTSFVAYNSVFRINATPGTLRLRLRLSTGLAGASVLIDDLCMGGLNPMYSGSPGWVVFSGATLFAGNDGWSIVNTNDQGGASFCATFQTGADRLLDMRGNGLLLPSASPGTIANTLITT